MNKLFSYFRSIYHDMCSSLLSSRGILTVLALLFFNYEYLAPLKKFAARYDVTFFPASLVFVFYEMQFILVFGLLTVFLFGEVPYINDRTKYTILRLGKRKWIAGKMIQIFLTSVIYMAAEFLVTIIFCGRYISFHNEWGKVWKTLSISSKAENVLWVPRNILIKYTPVEALVRVFVMGCLVVTMIGLFMLFLALLFSPVVSLTFSGIMAVLPFVAGNTAYFYSYIFYFTPVSWIGIIEYAKTYVYGGPNSNEMLGILGIIMLVLVLCNLFIVDRMDMMESKGELE